MAEIIADTRESKGANPHFEEIIKRHNSEPGNPEIKLTISQIGVGDYLIKVATALVAVIERKTWKDLAASIKDGRCGEQLEKMKKLRNETGAQILFIVQGSNVADNVIKGGIAASNLKAKLRHNMIRGYPYVRCDKAPDVAEFIYQLTRDYIKMYETGELSELRNIAGSEEELFRPKKEVTRDSINRDLWLEMPGIGPTTVDSFMKIGFAGMFASDNRSAVMLQVTELSRKAKLIEKITTYCAESSHHVGILARIPGVSVTRAKAILDQMTLSEVFANPERIADIRLNGKRLPATVISYIKMVA